MTLAWSDFATSLTRTNRVSSNGQTEQASEAARARRGGMGKNIAKRSASHIASRIRPAKSPFQS
jgi:hypothetical protein